MSEFLLLLPFDFRFDPVDDPGGRGSILGPRVALVIGLRGILADFNFSRTFETESSPCPVTSNQA